MENSIRKMKSDHKNSILFKSGSWQWWGDDGILSSACIYMIIFVFWGLFACLFHLSCFLLIGYLFLYLIGFFFILFLSLVWLVGFYLVFHSWSFKEKKKVLSLLWLSGLQRRPPQSWLKLYPWWWCQACCDDGPPAPRETLKWEKKIFLIVIFPFLCIMRHDLKKKSSRTAPVANEQSQSRSCPCSMSGQ